jgi:uncharacterized protein
MTRAAVLWTLLALFTGRVAGQLAVSLDAAPFLPPMEQWQSGLLPYPVLLVSQLLLIAGLGTICRQFSSGAGYFVEPQPWLGTPLWIAGLIYAGAMVVRYAVWMTLKPEQRWTGDLIPVAFHIVLASFLLTVAGHHRGDSPQRTPRTQTDLTSASSVSSAVKRDFWQ